MFSSVGEADVQKVCSPWAILLLLATIVSGCGPTRQPDRAQASAATIISTAPVAATNAEEPATPTAEPSPTVAQATPTVIPTQTATEAPNPTIEPSPTAPPTPTPDPWTAYAAYTIEGLRARDYGAGQIEIVQVMEETPAFTRYLIAYPSDDLRITGMMNRPKGDGPFPVVILNHGYYPLDVYQTGNGTKLAADYLATRGFLTLSPDFRSHAGSDDSPNLFRAGHVIDALNLIPLAQRLPDAQPGKVGMWGHSNGGAITSKAIVVSAEIAAAVIYAPASSNIVEDYEFRVGRARMRGGAIDRVEWPVTPEEGPDLYERLSPLPYLHYVQAPVQIHYGTADETVPLKWPDDLRAGLEAAGKEVTMHIYEGQPHSFQGAPNQLYLERMAAFFAGHLGLQP
jgi:dienelactone hydrolase